MTAADEPAAARSAKELVAHGAGELDWRVPDWAGLIDVPALDMSDPKYDVVGQLRPHYPYDALASIDQEDPHFGFNVDFRTGDDLDLLFAELDELWIAEIRKRTGGAA